MISATCLADHVALQPTNQGASTGEGHADEPEDAEKSQVSNQQGEVPPTAVPEIAPVVLPMAAPTAPDRTLVPGFRRQVFLFKCAMAELYIQASEFRLLLLDVLEATRRTCNFKTSARRGLGLGAFATASLESQQAQVADGLWLLLRLLLL